MPDNKTLSSEFAAKEELKKYMKRVMPFVQTTREKLEKLGAKALALTLEFDEAQVLKNNSIYLANTLDVEEVLVKYTDEEGATEKMKDCCPGVPFVVFSTKPGVRIEFVNPISHNGLFSQYFSVSDGDGVAKIAARLAKDVRGIKSKLALNRHRRS